MILFIKSISKFCFTISARLLIAFSFISEYFIADLTGESPFCSLIEFIISLLNESFSKIPWMYVPQQLPFIEPSLINVESLNVEWLNS